MIITPLTVWCCQPLTPSPLCWFPYEQLMGPASMVSVALDDKTILHGPGISKAAAGSWALK